MVMRDDAPDGGTRHGMALADEMACDAAGGRAPDASLGEGRRGGGEQKRNDKRNGHQTHGILLSQDTHAGPATFHELAVTLRPNGSQAMR
jgi:hypothetical protein